MGEAEEFAAMRDIVEELDYAIHRRVDQTIDDWGEMIALGVLIGLGTSLIAKAVLLTPENKRDEVGQVITKTIAIKLAEGGAALEGDKAIKKAMGKAD